MGLIKCPDCEKLFSDRIDACPNCGCPKETPEKVSENTPPTVSTVDNKPLGMAWYKFLIYFSLFAGAVLNIIYGIAYIFGGIYLVESNGQVSAAQVYAYYGPELQVVDILYGVLALAIAVLCFVVRHKLAKYKPDSLTFVKILYSLSAVVPFLYSILATSITGQNLPVQAVTSMGISFAFLFVNITYFKKRAHLFIDKTVPKQTSPNAQSRPQHAYKNIDVSIAAETSAPENKTNMFCRKCGTKLYEDSTFCHKCGTNSIPDCSTEESNIIQYHPAQEKGHKKSTNETSLVHPTSYREEKKTPRLDRRRIEQKENIKRKTGIALLYISISIVIVGVVWILAYINRPPESAKNLKFYNVSVRTITISPDDDDSWNSWAQANNKAESIVDEWKEGNKSEKSLISIFDKYGSSQGGGSIKIVKQGDFVTEVDTWLFDRERRVGDIAIIRNPYGYSICYISSFIDVEESSEFK